MPDRMRIVRSACRGCLGVCQVLVHLKGTESSRSRVTLKALPAAVISAPKEVLPRNYSIILID
jgi:hypothetical protein